MKVFAGACLLMFCVVLVTAQNRNRPTRRRGENNRGGTPAEQGRTLGLLGPLFSLGGFGGLGGVNLGYDQPIAPYRPAVRPQAAIRPQSDAYYGGGGDGYGGYRRYPNYGYGGYGYRPSYGYGGFFPVFSGYPISYGYRPQVYPGYGGGYPSYNYQRPAYSGAATSPSAHGGSGNVGVPAPGSSAAPPASSLSGAQAAEVANLLGQLLGQQLRPLINGATAADTPEDTANKPSSEPESSRRYY